MLLTKLIRFCEVQSRLRPLQASLEFLPLRFPAYEKRAIYIYPKSICQLKSRHSELMSRWGDLSAVVNSLSEILGRQAWTDLLKSVCSQTSQLLNYRAYTLPTLQKIAQCFEVIQYAVREHLFPVDFLPNKDDLERRWLKLQATVTLDNVGAGHESPYARNITMSERFSVSSDLSESTGATFSTFSSPTISSGTADSPIPLSPSSQEGKKSAVSEMRARSEVVFLANLETAATRMKTLPVNATSPEIMPDSPIETSDVLQEGLNHAVTESDTNFQAKPARYRPKLVSVVIQKSDSSETSKSNILEEETFLYPVAPAVVNARAPSMNSLDSYLLSIDFDRESSSLNFESLLREISVYDPVPHIPVARSRTLSSSNAQDSPIPEPRKFQPAIPLRPRQSRRLSTGVIASYRNSAEPMTSYRATRRPPPPTIIDGAIQELPDFSERRFTRRVSTSAVNDSSFSFLPQPAMPAPPPPTQHTQLNPELLPTVPPKTDAEQPSVLLADLPLPPLPQSPPPHSLASLPESALSHHKAPLPPPRVRFQEKAHSIIQGGPWARHLPHAPVDGISLPERKSSLQRLMAFTNFKH